MRNTDQYLVSSAAAAARPASAAQRAPRVAIARSIAHMASAQSGIRSEFWSHFRPMKLKNGIVASMNGTAASFSRESHSDASMMQKNMPADSVTAESRK